MMYKESAQLIEANRQSVINAIADNIPAKDAYFLVAPINIFRDEEMRQIFVDRCIEGSESNEYVLSDRWPHLYVSDQLIAWIIFKSQGDFTWLYMKRYLEALKANEEGKAS